MININMVQKKKKQTLHHLRKKKTKKRLGFVLSIFAFQDTYPSPQLTDIQHPGIAAEDKEAIHQLLHIINTLPEAQKTAIILAKIESRSQKEVAEIMGITIKAVESLLQRAKTNLSKKIHR
jgi:RNA polymerase sigma-70 factor (ECF subfamily)